MKNWVWLALIGLCVGFRLEAKLSNRAYDPVVISGNHLPAVMNAMPGELRLFAFQGGKFGQIVYQIDERYEDMLYWQWTRRRRELVYALTIGDKVKADPNPAFDSDDELAFMAMDLGDQAPAGALPAGAEVCQEIKVSDPNSGDAGYAYLCKLKNPAPLGDRQYISIAGSNNQVIGATYKIGYSTHDLFFDQLQLGPINNLSPNLIDRFKINYECFGAYGMFDYQLNNTDIRTHLRGIKVGPVRIIKEVVSITEPWAHIQNRLLHHIYYYPYHLEWEMETRGPIVWGNSIHQFIYTMALDLDPSVKGAQFLSEKNPLPVTVDGVYDAEELKLNYGPQEWMALSTKYGTIFNHLALPLKAQGLYPDLLYVDMDQKQDQPETSFGMFGKFGYKIKDLQKTGRKPVIFRLDYFFSPDPYTAGAEKNLVGIYTNSLKVESDQNQGTAVAQSLPTPEEKRKPGDQPLASMADKTEIKQATKSILPNFMLDPYNTGYGGGLSYSDEDIFKTGIGFSIYSMITTRNFYELSFDVYKLRFIPYVEDFKISAGIKQFPSETFYGIGNTTASDQAAIYWWTRNEASVEFRKHFLRHYGANFQLFYRDTDVKEGQQPVEGVQVGKPSYETHYGTWKQLEDMERWGGPVYGTDGGMTNGFNLSLYRDMRDDEQVPHRGDYESLSVYRVGPEFASDYNYTKLSLDGRVYFEPAWLQDLPSDHWFSDDRTTWTKFFGDAKHRNISIRAAATHTFSPTIDYRGQQVLDVPFWDLTTFGGGSTNRGYNASRFRDNDMFLTSVEYRWQYWRFWDVGVFLDTGFVADDLLDSEPWTDPEFHYGYGVSARAHLPPGVILSFEYVFSPEFQSGVANMFGWVF